MIDADTALQRLIDGNARFVNKTISATNPTDVGSNPALHKHALGDVANEQNPFAIILGCSDSRVPAEIVFDQGLGDLFVIRVAGNIVAPSQIGSIEFAVEKFGTRLVVVLGHTQCGAVMATLEELRAPAEARHSNLNAIVDRIKPAVAHLDITNQAPEDLIDTATRSNTLASVQNLHLGSSVIRDFVEQHGLIIVGSEYSLENGCVKFFSPMDMREPTST